MAVARGESFIARLFFASIVLLLVASACRSHSPSGPTPARLTIGGAWDGEQTVVSVTGGECLGPPLQDIVGVPSQFHAAIAQDGAALTATLDIDHLGASCTFEGSIDADVFELHATSCTESKQVGLTCDGGERRDILGSSATLRGTVAGDRITGMAIENDTVVSSGTTSPVGALVLTSTATLFRK
jgi:hypothetical protein